MAVMEGTGRYCPLLKLETILNNYLFVETCYSNGRLALVINLLFNVCNVGGEVGSFPLLKLKTILNN